MKGFLSLFKKKEEPVKLVKYDTVVLSSEGGGYRDRLTADNCRDLEHQMMIDRIRAQQQNIYDNYFRYDYDAVQDYRNSRSGGGIFSQMSSISKDTWEKQQEIRKKQKEDETRIKIYRLIQDKTSIEEQLEELYKNSNTRKLMPSKVKIAMLKKELKSFKI